MQARLPSLATGARAREATGERPLDVRELVNENHAFVWRTLRRLGVAPANVEDVTQNVFLTASRRLLDIERGKARSFLFGVAVRLAANERRAQRRSREGLEIDAHLEVPSPSPTPEEALRDREARQLLDEVLDGLSEELRAAYVLFDLERMTAPEVAECLGVPAGTVASRVRRARELVEQAIQRIHARHKGQEEGGR